MDRESRDDMMIMEGMMRAFSFFLPDEAQFDCFYSMRELFDKIMENSINGYPRKSD